MSWLEDAFEEARRVWDELPEWAWPVKVRESPWDKAAAPKPTRPEAPSYHDLYVTAPGIPRTRLFDLPYGYSVRCSRTVGWMLVRAGGHTREPDTVIGGEYNGKDAWLILDVNGHVIVNSRDREDET